MRSLFFTVFSLFILAVPVSSADSVPYAFETVAGGESGEDWETLLQSCASASASGLRLLGSAQIPLEGYTPYYWRQQDTGGRVKVDSLSLPDTAAGSTIAYQWYADGAAISGASSSELSTYQVNGAASEERINATHNAAFSAAITYTPATGCDPVTLNSLDFDYDHWRIYAGGEDGTVTGDNPTPFWETYSYNNDSSNQDSDGNLYTDSDIHNINAVRATDENIPARDGDYIIKILADGRNYGSSTAQSYSKRAELGNRNWPTRIQEDAEVFFSTSIYFPSAYWDDVSDYSIIVLQAKQYIGGEPNLVLRMSNAGDYKLYFQSKPHTDCDRSEECLVAQLSPDTWHDLKVRFKGADNGEGFMYVYVDGELKYSYEGTTLRETRDVYDPNITDSFLKFGMYTEIRDLRVIYLDDIEMTNHIDESIDDWTAVCADQATDSDCDGVVNTSDNCPMLGNANQTDTDSDGFGNVCDTDDDGDGVADGNDNCPLVSNANQLDSDADGLGDACDSVLNDNDPIVSLTSHSNFDDLPLNQEASLEATASDLGGAIESVSFYVDGLLIAEDTSSPYIASWTPTEIREYLLTARAKDNSGKVAGDSAAVSAGGGASSLELIATDDASVVSKSSRVDEVNNYSKVEVTTKSDYVIAGLFAFDLSSVPNDSGVRSATLKLTVDSINGPMEAAVYAAEGDWAEDSVTWNTRPTRSDDSVRIKNLTATQTYEFDVLSRLSELVSDGTQTATFWVEDASDSRNTLKFAGHTMSGEEPKLALDLGSVQITKNQPDEEAPTAPASLAHTAVTSAGATTVTWSASSDNVAVADYAVFLNGQAVAYPVTTSYSVSNLDISVDNTFTVMARDLMGNESPLSTPLLIQAEASDRDGDGIPDNADNCPEVSNPDQINTDGDEVGNLCDADDDNDGLTDVQEGELGTDPLKRDTDGDGWSDKEEVEEGTDPLAASSQPEIQSGLPVWLLYMATQ